MKSAGDSILIQELELTARIGVLEQERAKPQRLTVSMTMWLRNGFEQLHDDLAETVDYPAIARDVQHFASNRSDKLIETLADAIAEHLLRAYPLDRVQVELRKFVLPDAKFVAAICDRRR